MAASVNPCSAAEQWNLANEGCFGDFRVPASMPAWQRGASTTLAQPFLDVFGTTLDRQFDLDTPVGVALVPELASSDPDAALALMTMLMPPNQSLPPDEYFNKMVVALQDSTVGWGNVLGNLGASTTAALRAAWKRSASRHIQAILSGEAQSIVISPYVKIQSHKISKAGDLRKGAKLIVRVTGLPTKIVQKLEVPFAIRPDARSYAVRISARDVGRLERGATAIASARINSSLSLRVAKGGVLAFAPSAAIDFYKSYTSTSGFINVRNEFLALSAKSQSGNAVAVGAGMLAVSAVGAVGAPAMLLALGVGVIVQTAWITLGGDEAAGNLVRGWLD
jgi:hypothetical protein